MRAQGKGARRAMEPHRWAAATGRCWPAPGQQAQEGQATEGAGDNRHQASQGTNFGHGGAAFVPDRLTGPESVGLSC